jgi:hypothetical protein
MESQEKKPISKTQHVFTAIMLLVILVSVVYMCSQGKTDEESAQDSTSNQVGLNEPLKCDYFEVTARKVTTSTDVNTGNQFTDLKAGNGEKFLIINVTFKNIDTESRTLISGGPIYLNDNGKELQYDNPETIMADGWGLFLEPINPMMSKTTNLVYKIPNNYNGSIYWRPERANMDQRINLGYVQ